MESLPNVEDAVVLRVHGEGEYSSRVEDLGAGLVVVARPHDLPADRAFANGTDVTVAWSGADGEVSLLPTRILAAHPAGTLEVWSLVVTGPAITGPRREFDRVTAVGSVALRPAADSEAEPVAGSLVDVSERAIRCTVEVGSADAFLTGSSEVVAEFRFGAADFAVPGRVEFLRATARPAELEDLVVIFDEPVADADALRREVLDQQD